MHILVTGATGFVGSAVVPELIGAGHKVLGLARSDSGAAKLTAMGAEVHRGSMEDLESLRAGAAAADGVIHTAFNHDFSKFLDNCQLDKRAIEALGSALEGSDRPLLVTSGVALLAPGRMATEEDSHPPLASFPRASEAAAMECVARGVRAAVVRLPPSVHGAGDHGFVPILIGLARDKGIAAYVGEGLNRWPAVQRFDAARLYRLAIENCVAGTRYHAIAEEGLPFKDIGVTIGGNLDIPVAGMAPAQAEAYFGWFTRFAAIDAPSSSERTRKLLGWAAAHTGLLADMEQHYFGA